MNISTIIDSLRYGRALKNKLAWKWAGFAGLAAGMVLNYAKSKGWMQGVSDQEFVDLLTGLVDLAQAFGLFTIVSTSESVGLLPAARPTAPIVRDDRPVPPLDYAPAGKPGEHDPGQGGDEFWGRNRGALDEH